MKIYYLLSFLLFTLTLNAQIKDKGEDPNTYLDLAAGLGSSYGLSGVKSVIGYKGSGLLLGVGKVNGESSISVGLQFRYEIWFLSVGSGPFGYYEERQSAIGGYRVTKGQLRSIFAIFGTQINLWRNRLFLELGLGVRGGDSYRTQSGGRISDGGGIVGGIGLGYRIGWGNNKQEE